MRRLIAVIAVSVCLGVLALDCSNGDGSCPTQCACNDGNCYTAECGNNCANVCQDKLGQEVTDGGPNYCQLRGDAN